MVTSVRLAAIDATGLALDAIVVGLTTGKRDGTGEIPVSSGLGAGERKRILEAVGKVSPKIKAGDVIKIPGVNGVDASLIVAVAIGVGAEALTPELLRQAAGAGTMCLADVDRIGVVMPGNSPADVAATAQGAILGSYRFESFRGTGTARVTRGPRTVTVLTETHRDRHVREAVRQAEIVAEEVCRARDLVNTPPSALHPKELAAAALEAVAGLDVTTQVLDERGLKRGKFGGILAVGQGSVNTPRLIRLAYRPARSKVHVALVGKGITFDSGGLSLKPPTAMETMKMDMGGAAAVIAATAAIAKLGLPASVTTYAACAENMPSGTAQRPGDVLTTYGGTTVEVLNTDAEGRLVLADALVRAGEDEPDVIIDVATLTGAQIVALGTRISAVMSNDDELRDDIVRSAAMVGEQFWPMPLPAELRPSLDSPIADIANIGDRMGGMLTAGLFLQDFIADDISWAHMDIAGPAFNESDPHDYTPKGGTGVAVRTLVQVVRDLADSHTA